MVDCQRAGKRGGGGAIRDKLPSSQAAELIALVNALHLSIKFELVQEGDHVLLQSDCQGALDALAGRRSQTMTKAEREARTVIYEIKRKHALTFSFRHVKGHSNRPEARYVTNNMCDLRARAGMELARKKHGGLDERD